MAASNVVTVFPPFPQDSCPSISLKWKITNDSHNVHIPVLESIEIQNVLPHCTKFEAINR